MKRLKLLFAKPNSKMWKKRDGVNRTTRMKVPPLGYDSTSSGCGYLPPGCGGSHHRDKVDYRIRVRYHRIQEGDTPLLPIPAKTINILNYIHMSLIIPKDYKQTLTPETTEQAIQMLKNQLPGETVESVEPAPRNRPFIRSLGEPASTTT